jgi:hypothetical protein
MRIGIYPHNDQSNSTKQPEGPIYQGNAPNVFDEWDTVEDC